MTEKQLIRITKKLGYNHERKTKFTKHLEADRQVFFDAVTEYIESSYPLKRQTIDLVQHEMDVGNDLAPLEEWITEFYPGWRLVQAPTNGIAIIEEDPCWVKWAYVNPKDGMVYQRNVIEGTPQLNDEALEDEWPEVWERVTRQVTTRELIPFDQIDTEDLVLLQEYMVPGKLKYELSKPRKAKPEELE